MGYMDHTLKKTVPYYSTMKRAGAFKQQEPRKQKKRTTLTEYSQLSPHEVVNLVEQVQNLTRRVKKYESWEE
jgi:hypothetical protein